MVLRCANDVLPFTEPVLLLGQPLRFSLQSKGSMHLHLLTILYIVRRLEVQVRLLRDCRNASTRKIRQAFQFITTEHSMARSVAGCSASGHALRWVGDLARFQNHICLK